MAPTTSAVNRPEINTPLLTLPLELREHIYEEVLTAPNQGPQLLQTCREVHSEAYKFLFHRVVHFVSQQKLFNWLNEVPPKYLDHVTQISLHIQDVSVRSLLQQEFPGHRDSGGPQLQIEELHEREIRLLREALVRLPKIKGITVRALSGSQYPFYRQFLSKILGLMSSLFPTLRDLRLEGNMHYQSLEFLESLIHLQSFSFDGFSASSSTETASILARLQNLTSLSLISQHGMLTPNSHVHSSFTAKTQAFNSDVIRAISQLVSFSITERRPNSVSPLFFTSEVLASLDTQQKLRKLSVFLSQNPDKETLKALQNYLARSCIERLEVDWPDLDPGIVEQYSLMDKSVQILWIRARSRSDALDIMESVYNARERGTAQALKKIVLVRSRSVYSDALKSTSRQEDSQMHEVDGTRSNEHSPTDEKDDDAVKLAHRRLTMLGIEVAWSTEDA